MEQPKSERIHVSMTKSEVENLDAWWRARPDIKSRADGIRFILDERIAADMAGQGAADGR